MAEPTLKDVLAALAALGKKMATKDALNEVSAKVDAVAADVKAHRAETAKGFDDLDAELTGHTKLHRDIERKLEVSSKKPARASPRTARRR